MKNIFTEGWELRYEAEFIAHNKDKIQAYICSPLRAATSAEVQRNMRTARAYMVYAFEAMHFSAVAPHAYLPVILDDDKPSEMALALQIGLQMLFFCNIILVCGDRISEGMKGEIRYAARLNKQIYTFNTEMYSEVQQIVSKDGKNPELVSLHLGHSPLGSSCPVTNFMQTKLDVTVLVKERSNAVSV